MASVVSWSVRWTPDRAVLVRALAGDIMLCSWTRHFTLTVPLSTRGVQTGASEFNAGGGGGGGGILQWTSMRYSVASCYIET